MGHNIVVGRGKFVRPLFKRAAPSQVRTAHEAKAKAKPPVAALNVPALQLTQPEINILMSNRDDFRSELESQHDTWCTEFHHTSDAVLLAHLKFNEIMRQTVPPSTGMALFGAVFQILAFTVLPGLGPVTELAKKLVREEESARKLAELACEKVKSGIEKGLELYKQEREAAEVTKLKHDSAGISIKFFERILKSMGSLEFGMTQACNNMRAFVSGSDWPQLRARLMQAKGMWTASGFERNVSGYKTEFPVDQLALLFLYELMRDYCKSCVTLTGLMVETQVPLSADDNWRPGGSSVRAITKEEFAAERRKDPKYDANFEGLNQAQRKKMYEEFSAITFTNPKHPRVSTWLELIANWEFKEEG